MTADLFLSFAGEGLRLALRPDGTMAVSGPDAVRQRARGHAEGLKAFLARSASPEWAAGAPYEGSGLEARLAVLTASFAAESAWSASAASLERRIRALDQAARSSRADWERAVQAEQAAIAAALEDYTAAWQDRHRTLRGPALRRAAVDVFRQGDPSLEAALA